MDVSKFMTTFTYIVIGCVVFWLFIITTSSFLELIRRKIHK